MIDVTSNNSNVVDELGLEETVATILKLLHISFATTFNLLRSCINFGQWIIASFLSWKLIRPVLRHSSCQALDQQGKFHSFHESSHRDSAMQ